MNGMSRSREKQQSPQDALNRAAAGNSGGGEGFRALREWGEYDRVRRRGMAEGHPAVVTDGDALERMERFCPEWDGDMRWPPPGFLGQKALLTQRANALEQQQQRGAGFLGLVPHASQYAAPLSPFEVHLQRCHQSTQQASARNDQWMASMGARSIQDRQRQDVLRNQEKDREHARQMQQSQFEHERKMRQMEIDAQWRGWRS